MARKKVREYDGKRLLARHFAKLNAPPLGGGACRAAQVTSAGLGARPAAFYAHLAEAHPWLSTAALVVKPDMLFGQRGKHDLVLLRADYAGAQAFIAARLGREIDVGRVRGVITAFIIEEFVPHADEYYLSIASGREGDVLRFGACGGVDIEANWERVRTVHVPVGLPGRATVLSVEDDVKPLLVDVPAGAVEAVALFVAAAFQTYVDLDMSLLEMNPFALDGDGRPAVLDARVELDSYATFKNQRAWGADLEFPEPWGREKSDEERAVQALDDKSGASMKLTILNDTGRIWTMVAGGGASVIYADT